MKIPETGDIRRRFLLFVQVSLILLPVTAFFDAALFYRGRINLSVTVAAAVFVLLNGALISFTCAAIYSYFKIFFARKMNSARYGNLQRRTGILSLLPLFAVVILFTALALSQFGKLPVYDAGLYYSPLITATETFEFTISSFLSHFSLCRHPTQGFALLAGAGEMLFPRQSVGVYTVSLLLTDAAILCLFGIMGRLFPTASAWVKAAGTAVFAFCPYILGLFSYPTPDYYLTMILVIMIWCFAEKLDFLAAFLTLLICFCKETGIILAGSFLLTAMLIRICQAQEKGFFRKAFRYLFPKRVILYGTVPALFVLYFRFMGNLNFGSDATGRSPLTWDSGGEHCFGINITNIEGRLSQFYLYNFHWLIFLIALLAAAILLYRRSRADKSKARPVHAESGVQDIPGEKGADNSIAAGIAASTLIYLAFLCLFITFLCPRYSTVYSLPLSLLSVFSITWLVRRKALSAILLSCLAGLFLIQSYVNIDPAITLTCPKLFAGSRYLYSPTSRIFKNTSNDYSMEIYVYNLSYAYSEDLIEKVYERIHLSDDDNIFCVEFDWYRLNLIGDIYQTNNLIYWDPINNRQTYDDSGEYTLLPHIIFGKAEDILGDTVLRLPDDFYFFLPARRSEEFVDAVESRGYKTVDSFTERNYVGYINVYHMKKTN